MIIPIVVEVYKSDGSLRVFYQSGSGGFIGCEFSFNESGCRDFSLFFAGYQGIQKNDTVKIYFTSVADPFFFGVIRKIPITGSTNLDFTYSGYGLNDFFVRINTESQSYSSTTVGAIVNDLVDSIITVKSPITKNAGKIDVLNIAVDSIVFDYIQINEALDQLKKIADSDGNNYLVGVDADGEFFFKAKDTSVLKTLVVGKNSANGISEYQPEDIDEPRSKLYVKRADGTYYASYQSTEDIPLFEEKLTAPDIADNDIDRWAAGILARKEITTRQASIIWKIEETNPIFLIADGSLRIISNIINNRDIRAVENNNYGDNNYGDGLYGGAGYPGYTLDDTLEIMEVKYKITSNDSIREIQLGSLPIQLDREILTVNKNIEDLRISLGR